MGALFSTLTWSAALAAAQVLATPLVAQELPRVLVIATGGTIAGQATGGQLTGAQIVEAVPQLAEVARIEVEEFSRVGSSAITPDHWVRLSRRINEIFDTDPDLAGLIVTHGTDTLEETAYFLHLTVEDARPVVVVGSMRNSSAVSADGPANLLSGARVVLSPKAHERGVLVVLNDEIHSARDVRKMDNNRLNTFVSREWGMLGIVDADQIVFRRSPGDAPHRFVGSTPSTRYDSAAERSGCGRFCRERRASPSRCACQWGQRDRGPGVWWGSGQSCGS